MDIATALIRITAIQRGLTVSSIVEEQPNGTIAAITIPTITVKRAYPYTPDAASALPDVPCWMNTVTLLPLNRVDATWRIQRWDVRMQLFAYDAGQARAQAIALAFLTAAINAFDADPQLAIAGAPSVTQADIRGEATTLGRLEWAGRGYMGLSLVLGMEMKEAVSLP